MPETQEQACVGAYSEPTTVGSVLEQVIYFAADQTQYWGDAPGLAIGHFMDEVRLDMVSWHYYYTLDHGSLGSFLFFFYPHFSPC